MTRYRNATVESYFPGVGLETDSCHVSLDGADIVVDGGQWVCHGKEEGPGHYRLERRERGKLTGTATLHRFEGAGVLVGDWKVDKYAGMWLIRLGSGGNRGADHAD